MTMAWEVATTLCSIVLANSPKLVDAYNKLRAGSSNPGKKEAFYKKKANSKK